MLFVSSAAAALAVSVFHTRISRAQPARQGQQTKRRSEWREKQKLEEAESKKPADCSQCTKGAKARRQASEAKKQQGWRQQHLTNVSKVLKITFRHPLFVPWALSFSVIHVYVPCLCEAYSSQAYTLEALIKPRVHCCNYAWLTYLKRSKLLQYSAMIGKGSPLKTSAFWVYLAFHGVQDQEHWSSSYYCASTYQWNSPDNGGRYRCRGLYNPILVAKM